ncbi:MAG: NAD-dependent epimerase/dehydratase family protein, partial [Candidatus Bathyarchaeia archaeon]
MTCSNTKVELQPAIEIEGNRIKGKTVLITGGAGFIGSWLAETLARLGAKVTVLDNLLSGSLENLKHLFDCGSLDFMEGDVSSFRIIDKYDYIVHAASIPAPDTYVIKPIETMLPNSLGTLNVLEASRKHGSRVLYLSTSEVYGDAEIVPTPESYWGHVNPIGVRSCYDESKRFGEALCMAFFRQYNIDIRIARIFNTYGPRSDPNARYARVISKFIIQALSGQPITVHGDGRQTRSFLYIFDAVEALIKLLFGVGLNGEVVNIGNPSEITILELAEIIKR